MEWKVENIGPMDKIIRYIAGIIIMVIGYYNQSLLGSIGLLLVLSALVGTCPIYALLDISTVSAKSLKNRMEIE